MKIFKKINFVNQLQPQDCLFGGSCYVFGGGGIHVVVLKIIEICSLNMCESRLDNERFGVFSIPPKTMVILLPDTNR